MCKNNEQDTTISIGRNLVTWYKFMFPIWHKHVLSPIFLFSRILRFCGQCSVFNDQRYYWYLVQVSILHVAIIKAESILCVHEPVLKNTDQGWWTFQNRKLLAKGQTQIIFMWKVKSDVNFELTYFSVPVWTPYSPNWACDSWFVLARPFWNLPGWTGERQCPILYSGHY